MRVTYIDGYVYINDYLHHMHSIRNRALILHLQCTCTMLTSGSMVTSSGEGKRLSIGWNMLYHFFAYGLLLIYDFLSCNISAIYMESIHVSSVCLLIELVMLSVCDRIVFIAFFEKVNKPTLISL